MDGSEMKIIHGMLPRVTEIHFSGQLTSALPDSFSSLVDDLLAEGHNHFLVNLDLDFFNPIGLGSIIRLNNEAIDAGGDCSIYSLRPRIIQVFCVPRNPFPPFFDTREDALCYLLRKVPAQVEV
jgi:anti-anti-sigma regulatory factor